MTIVRTDNHVILSWPASATGYFLEQNLDATGPDVWSFVGVPVVVSDFHNTVTLSLANRMGSFRLAQTASPWH